MERENIILHNCGDGDLFAFSTLLQGVAAEPLRSIKLDITAAFYD